MHIGKLDFSEYHDLFHSLWECRGYPGGRRRHINYLWDFKYRDRLRELTLCKIGRHIYVDWFLTVGPGELGGPPVGRSCLACWDDDPTFQRET